MYFIFDKRDRLSSIDLLQVKKLKEHVYQKILKLDETTAAMNGAASSGQQQQQQHSIFNDTSNSSNVNGGVNANHSSTYYSTQGQSSHSMNGNSELSGSYSPDLLTIAHRTIELICSDQVSVSSALLQAIHFWRCFFIRVCFGLFRF